MLSANEYYTYTVYTYMSCEHSRSVYIKHMCADGSVYDHLHTYLEPTYLSRTRYTCTCICDGENLKRYRDIIVLVYLQLNGSFLEA